MSETKSIESETPAAVAGAAPCSAFAREVCTLLADESLQYAAMADALQKEGHTPRWAAVIIMRNIEGPSTEERWRDFGRSLGFRV